MKIANTKDETTSSAAARRLPALLATAALIGLMPSAGLLVASPAAALEQGNNGAKARISRSAALRSLTEAVASASCRVSAGMNVDSAMAELAKTTEDFTAIVSGLIDGDPALGMPGAETRARMLASLDATASAWAPIKVAASNLANGTGNAADATAVRDGYAALFAQTEQTAADVAGQYVYRDLFHIYLS